MARNYKPATFQPTIRPDWGGTISYIPDNEKALILEAMLKYPSIECNAKFWLETIKPEFDFQYSEFLRICEQKSRGVRNRWGKISITDVKDIYNISNTDVIDSKRKDKGKNKEEDKGVINKPKKIIKPSLDDIKQYAIEKNRIDLAQKFFDYYDTGDWKDKDGKQVKNWKQKFITWINNNQISNKSEVPVWMNY